MTLFVLCAAAFAIVAFATSVVVGVALGASEGSVERLAPAAQARVYLAASLLPFLAGAAVLAAVLAPSFGWIADHCGPLGSVHAHSHICAQHGAASWPALSSLAMAAVLVVRFVTSVARQLYAVVLGRVARARFDRSADAPNPDGLRVLPVDDAQAFVLGLLRPRLYVTRGLVAGSARTHLDAVLAHERAHMARRDPLRRFVAGLGAGFHLPGVAGWLGARLAQAQEMAADEVAAQTLGSREAVASAVVALAKARQVGPSAALAFSGSNVEHRVQSLLDGDERRDTPSPQALGVAAFVALAAVAAGADTVHHGIETLLGALGS